MKDPLPNVPTRVVDPDPGTLVKSANGFLRNLGSKSCLREGLDQSCLIGPLQKYSTRVVDPDSRLCSDLHPIQIWSLRKLGSEIFL